MKIAPLSDVLSGMKRESYAEAGRIFLEDVLRNPMPSARAGDPESMTAIAQYMSERDVRLDAAMSAVGWGWQEWRQHVLTAADRDGYAAVMRDVLSADNLAAAHVLGS